MRKTFKIIGWTLGVVVVLFVVAAGAALLLVNSEFVRAQIENHANAVSGRKTKIGDLAIHWGRTTQIRLGDVEVSNADWGKADHMFKAQEIAVDIELMPLLHGNIVLPQLHLVKPELYLERNDKDESNWSMKESPAAAGVAQQAAPSHREETPEIGQLAIDGGVIGYLDPKRKLALKGTVQTATGQAGAQPQAQLSLNGNLEGQPLTVSFIGGSILMLRDTKQPYPLNLDIHYGDTHLTAKGTMDEPFQYQGADIQLSLSGPNLADVYPLLGIPGPPTPPYTLSGKLDHAPNTWRLSNMAAHVGNSDIAGTIDIDQRVKPARLVAKLESDHLAFADLAPLVGASPGTQGPVSAEQKATGQKLKAEGNLFPDTPMHTERLRAMNMDVTLNAHHLTAPSYLPAQSIDARVQVQDGRALVDPFEMGFGGGTVAGKLEIDAKPDMPKVGADLNLSNIELGAFFKGSRFFDTTKGSVQGRVALAGDGKSLAQVMGTANGKIQFAMTNGSISSLMVSLAGLQIVDALVLYVTGDNRIPIRCTLGELDFDRGAISFHNTLMDTTKSVLHFSGQAELGSQAIDSKITADPKQFSLMDLHAPIDIEGKIRKPDISIGRAIPIPTPDFGGAGDVDCDARIHSLLADKR